MFSGLEKKKGREWIAHMFRRLTGQQQVSAGRQLWELCYLQTDPAASLFQFCSMGLIGPKQYRGVDRNPEIIEVNRKAHPSLQFYVGEWEDTVRAFFTEGAFRPEIIYLDTQVMPDGAARLAASTMILCPERTLLVVNMVTENVYQGWRKKTIRDFIWKLSTLLPEPVMKQWNGRVQTFIYLGERGIQMLQVALYKP